AAARSAAERAELATAELASARERSNVDQRVRTDLETRLAQVEEESAAPIGPAAREAGAGPAGGAGHGRAADAGRDVGPDVGPATDGFERAQAASAAAQQVLDAARQADAGATGEATAARHQLALLEERWAAHRAGTVRHEQAKARLGELDGELQAIIERSTTLVSEVAVAEERLSAARAALPTGLAAEEAAAEAARVTVVRGEADVAARSEAQASLAVQIEESKVQ